jgi:hypothetical protein
VVHSLFKEYHTCARSFSLLPLPALLSLSRLARKRLLSLLLKQPKLQPKPLPKPLLTLLQLQPTPLLSLPTLLLSLPTLLLLLRTLLQSKLRITVQGKGAQASLARPFFLSAADASRQVAADGPSAFRYK